MKYFVLDTWNLLNPVKCLNRTQLLNEFKLKNSAIPLIVENQRKIENRYILVEETFEDEE